MTVWSCCGPDFLGQQHDHTIWLCYGPEISRPQHHVGKYYGRALVLAAVKFFQNHRISCWMMDPGGCKITKSALQGFFESGNLCKLVVSYLPNQLM